MYLKISQFIFGQRTVNILTMYRHFTSRHNDRHITFMKSSRRTTSNSSQSPSHRTRLILHSKPLRPRIRTSSKQRSPRKRKLSEVFSSTVIIQDSRVAVSTISKAIQDKHFVRHISPRAALTTTTKRFGNTSNGGRVQYNTVFERPTHLKRVTYWERGEKCDRLISSEPLPTYQCYYDISEESWRAGFVGHVFFVLNLHDHLDKKIIMKQFQHDFRKNSFSIADINRSTYHSHNITI